MSVAGTVWTPIGPSPIQAGRQDNGLVAAIAINPNDPNVIFIGTAGGGVWRSRDGGLNWRPLFDRQIALGIGEPGAIAIDPTNTDTIYIGTSQRVAGALEVGSGWAAPTGLFKSTDGGAMSTTTLPMPPPASRPATGAVAAPRIEPQLRPPSVDRNTPSPSTPLYSTRLPAGED